MFAPINYAGPQPFNDWFAPDTTQRVALGMMVEAVDPFWGYGQFQYVKSNGTILKGSLVTVGGLGTFLGTLTPSTANLGQPFGVAMAPMASGTYGWLQVAGLCVYKCENTVAADVAVAVTTAGIGGTNAAGKQLLNFHQMVSATGTKTAVVNTFNGSPVLKFRDGYDGMFIGGVITGTGIGAATTVIAKLDPDGVTAYAGSAIGVVGDKNSTATGQITLTLTYTGFSQAMIMYPFTQGAIT